MTRRSLVLTLAAGVALATVACSGDDAPVVVLEEEIPAATTPAVTDTSPEIPSDPAEPDPATVTADPAEAFPDGVADDLVLVQDFDAPVHLAAYTPDGDLAATYVGTTTGVVWQPIWAPDGRSVAWAASADGVTWTLVVADADGGAQREYPLPGRPDYLTFDPTVSRVASLTPSPEGFGLAIVELDGDDWTIVDIGRPYYSDFAPDGLQLISHVAADLRIVRPDGTAEPTGIDSVTHQTPVWHPDGDRILVTDSTDGTATLVAVDVATGAATTVAQFGDFVLLAVDPTGRYAAVSSFDLTPGTDTTESSVEALRAPETMREGLWVVGIDTAERIRLSDVVTTAPLWDPTGTRLLVRDTAAGIGSWTVYDLDGAVIATVERDITSSLMPNYLPFWDQFTRSQTLWSPDGTRFVHVGTDADGTAGVWIHEVDADDSSRFLVDGELAFWSPT